MAIVQQFICDGCTSVINETDVCKLENMKAHIRGKDILIIKDLHFCSPACLLSHVHNMISSSNGVVK